MLKLGPDNKIYLSQYLDNNDCGFLPLLRYDFYPENMNISVIHQPNELGRCVISGRIVFIWVVTARNTAFPTTPTTSWGRWRECVRYADHELEPIAGL